jgi:hypothetical protein
VAARTTRTVLGVIKVISVAPFSEGANDEICEAPVVHLRMLLKGFFHSYAKGIYSSREMEERTEIPEHLDFAIKEFREMKMQPLLKKALRHKETPVV